MFNFTINISFSNDISHFAIFLFFALFILFCDAKIRKKITKKIKKTSKNINKIIRETVHIVGQLRNLYLLIIMILHYNN